MCGMMRTEKYLEHVSLNPAFRIYPVDVRWHFTTPQAPSHDSWIFMASSRSGEETLDRLALEEALFSLSFLII
jgi:hypothetical protein